MDLSKSFEFFDPAQCKEKIHIIGCGSVGSTVAELLVRFGLKDFVLYDFDIVSSHNLVNQMFVASDMGKEKTECLKNHMLAINPELTESIKIEPNGWHDQKLNGYVFLCVDDIELRKKIVQDNMYNLAVKAMFDFRTGLTDAQHFAADWGRGNQKKNFLATMNFTNEEADAAVPMSACHIALCVAPTVRWVANVGVTNFINFVKEGKIETGLMMDAFRFTLNII